MDTDALPYSEKEALLGLLDDRSPVVRRALLARFSARGVAAAALLQEVAHSSNRVLARHAAWFIDELKLTDPVTEFRTFIRSLNYELETGALLLARTVTPDLDIGECRAGFDEMAARCRELISEPSTNREKCRVINRVLFHEWGFRGNVEQFTDPMNSFIDKVLMRRKGIPISLSVLYLLVGERLGLPLEPVGLPGHFVVGCYADDAPFFIDPFDQGLFRDADEVFALLRSNHISPKPSDLAPTTIREVLCRSCRNLANHYSAASDLARAQIFSEFANEFEATHERYLQP
ncbi:MAG TPA: transglutaminase-like domain-containing protein [Opitutaceae bacterium]|nr:transglutaminase-like domain-containing protein [Opitutaceae bacterium]